MASTEAAECPEMQIEMKGAGDFGEWPANPPTAVGEHLPPNPQPQPLGHTHTPPAYRPYIAFNGVAVVICLFGLLLPRWVEWGLVHKSQPLSFLSPTKSNAPIFLSQTTLGAGPTGMYERAIVTDVHVKGRIGLWDTKLDLKIKAAMSHAPCESGKSAKGCVCSLVERSSLTGLPIDGSGRDGLDVTPLADGLPQCDVKVIRCDAKFASSVPRDNGKESLMWVTELEADCDSTIISSWSRCGAPFRRTAGTHGHPSGSPAAAAEAGAQSRLAVGGTSKPSPGDLPAGDVWGGEQSAGTGACSERHGVGKLDNCMRDWLRAARGCYIIAGLLALVATIGYFALPFLPTQRNNVSAATLLLIFVALSALGMLGGVLFGALSLRLGCGNSWDNLSHSALGSTASEGTVYWGAGLFFAIASVVLSAIWTAWAFYTRKEMVSRAASLYGSIPATGLRPREGPSQGMGVGERDMSPYSYQGPSVDTYSVTKGVSWENPEWHYAEQYVPQADPAQPESTRAPPAPATSPPGIAAFGAHSPPKGTAYPQNRQGPFRGGPQGVASPPAPPRAGQGHHPKPSAKAGAPTPPRGGGPSGHGPLLKANAGRLPPPAPVPPMEEGTEGGDPIPFLIHPPPQQSGDDPMGLKEEWGEVEPYYEQGGEFDQGYGAAQDEADGNMDMNGMGGGYDDAGGYGEDDIPVIYHPAPGE